MDNTSSSPSLKCAYLPKLYFLPACCCVSGDTADADADGAADAAGAVGADTGGNAAGAVDAGGGDADCAGGDADRHHSAGKLTETQVLLAHGSKLRLDR